MSHPSRRRFVLHVVCGAPALAVAASAQAQEATRLTESEPYPRSMGFKLDTNQVDQAKYPRHEAATQQCSKCQLFSGKAGEAVGPCSFYGGRLVPVGGWCRNFKVRKEGAAAPA